MNAKIKKLKKFLEEIIHAGLKIKISFIYLFLNRRFGLLITFFRLIIIVWKDIYSGSDTNRIGPEGLFFYYFSCCTTWIRCCQMLMLIQHRVSSFKPSDLVSHVVPDVWGTLLGGGLRFV